MSKKKKKAKLSSAPLYGLFGFFFLIIVVQIYFMYKNSRNPSHGGIIKEVNGRHFELLYFPDDGHLGLFLLDDETGGTNPIDRQTLTAKVKFKNSSTAENFEMSPHKQSSDSKSEASFFMACNKSLRHKKDFDVNINLMDVSKPYSLSFHVQSKAHSPNFRFKDSH